MSKSLEEQALECYTNYWEAMDNPYATRWQMLGEHIKEAECNTAYRYVREACVEMFKAGFMLRLTGE